AERNATIEQTLTALNALPGVEVSAAAMRIPLRGNGNSTGISIVGRDSTQSTTTYFRIGTLEYFSTMGIKLVEGRAFDATDQPGPIVSVVINRALAKKYFPGENPIGQMLGGMYNVPQRIIGIVDDVAEGTLTAGPAPARYYLWSQVAGGFGTPVTFVIRTKRGTQAEAVLNEAQRTLKTAAPG